MYISKVRLINVRCFEDEKIDLSSEEGIRKWLLITGDNGVGKTTLLQSIAMGLCDETGASGLLQDTDGDWIRWGAPNARIIIDILGNGKTYSIETIIHKTKAGGEGVSQNVTPSGSTPWENIFVCGYGANRSIYGDGGHSKYSAPDALYTLFNYEYSLQSPELMLRRYARNSSEIAEICAWLDEVLMLEAGSAQLDEHGLHIAGNWKENVYLGSLPDGYSATITLMLDLLGWALLAKRKGEKNKLSGIILIDEIEQHLHPKWQRNILSLLSGVFENIQFIATTHSPMCVVSASNLQRHKKICSLACLQRKGDFVQIIDKIEPPLNERADQLLTSSLFGLSTSGSDLKKESTHRYAALQSKERTGEENKEFNLLQIYLDENIGAPETTFEILISKAVKQVLLDQGDIRLENKETEKGIDFEISRQLDDLLKGK